MLRFFAGLCQRHAKKIVIIWFVLTVPLVWGITRLEIKTSQRDMIPTRYESARAVQHLDEEFAGMSYEFILIKDADMTSYPMVKKLILFESELYRQVSRKDIVRVDVYLNDLIKGAKEETGKELIDEDFFKSYEGKLVPSPLGGMADFKTVLLQGVQLMLDNPTGWKWIVEKSNLLTPDKKGGQVVVKVSPTLSPGRQQEVAGKIEKFARSYFGSDPELGNPSIMVTGDSSVARDLNRYLFHNTLLLIVIAFAFLLIVLYLTFRRLTDVLLPLFIIALSVAWIFGLMGWLHVPFTLISVALAPLILGINIADIVYMMSRFYEEIHGGADAREAARLSIVTVGVAVFLAAISTMIGFASFTLSDLPAVVQFGLMACFGEAIGFLLSVTLLPSFMIWREERLKRLKREPNLKRLNLFARGRTTILDGILHRSATLASQHPWRILIITSFLVIISFMGVGRLETASDLRNLIPGKLPSVQAQFEQERLWGGQQTDFVVVYGDILTPDTLRAMEEFRVDLGSRVPFTERGIISLPELFYDVLRDVKGRQGDFDAVVPSTVEGVRRDYEELKGYLGGDFVTEDGKVALITINSVAARNSREVLEKRDILHGVAAAHLNQAGLHYEVGGISPLTADLLGNLVPTQIFTSIFALILSGLVLMLIFQSILLGLATLSVLLAGIAVEMGFMVLVGWPLDMLTVLVSSMVIGVGIDYGIHITWRFREEYGFREERAADALDITIMSVGRPIVASAGATAGAFLIITLTEIMPVRRFGGVTAISLAISMLAGLLVLPALLTLLARWRRKSLVRKRYAEEKELALEPLVQSPPSLP